MADNIDMTTAFAMKTERPASLQLAGRRVHFVGIAGVGMSGLARLVQRQGASCTGSDMASGEVVDALESDGFSVALEQNAQSVPIDCELLVASAAIAADHPELIEARRRGIPVLKYAAMLGHLMSGRTGVAVAGTHGKSTTTSMLSHALIHTGLDPSFIVGATCQQIGGGSRTGESEILVAEACEYDRSFHNLNPTHALILNVEEDHLDCYGSLEAIVESFAAFARRLPAHGSLLIGHEIPHRRAITADLECAVETLGFAADADWRVVFEPPLPHAAAPVEPDPAAGDGDHRPSALATLMHREVPVCRWPSPLPGKHMAYNAAAAAVTAHRLGAHWSDIAEALASFRGLDRRMQYLGAKTWPGPVAGTGTDAEHTSLGVGSRKNEPILVIDDYGHHPTEIDATLRALREHYRPKRLICVFQPHQHSRTRFLIESFATSFRAADWVIVPDIYFVRDSEKERQAVTAAALVDRLRQKGVNAMHMHPFEAIVAQLGLIAQPGDLLVTMGAGDVWRVAHDFLER